MIAIRIIIGLIPSFAWLLFYLHEDAKHDEAKKLLAEAFFFGAVATFFVLPVQLFLHKEIPFLDIKHFELPSFFILGFFEELFKFLAVFVFISRKKNFTAEPIHVMIYMITAALGFAAVENVASALRADPMPFLSSAVLQSVTLRFIGATLLHTLSSGFLGYYWARGMALRRYEAPLLVWGIFIATLLHAIFNTLIITTGPASYAIILLVFAAFFLLNDFEKLKQQPSL